MSTSVRTFVALWLLLAAGCPQSEGPPSQTETSESVPPGESAPEQEPEPETAEPLPQDDPAAVAALEELGVVLSHDRAGRIITVDASELQSGFTDEHIALLAGLPALATLNLDFSQVTNDGLALLKANPEIRVLSLQRCGNVDDAGLAHLQDLPKLEQLILLYNTSSVTNAGMEHIGQIRSLRLLDLRGCKRVSDEGIAPLANLANLAAFKYQGNAVGDEGLASLAGLTKMRSLILEKCRISNEGLGHVSQMADLQELNLYGTPVDDAGLEHLQGLTKLKDLKLRDTAIVGTGLVHLHPSKETMWRLDLSETFVTDEGLANVAAFTNLESLNLWYAGVTDAGMAHLAELTKLRELNLEECDVGDDGLVEIAKLEALENLNVGKTRITDDGLATLQSLTNLKSLDLSNTQVSDEGLEDFRKAVPDCDVKQ